MLLKTITLCWRCFHTHFNQNFTEPTKKKMLGTDQGGGVTITLPRDFISNLDSQLIINYDIFRNNKNRLHKMPEWNSNKYILKNSTMSILAINDFIEKVKIMAHLLSEWRKLNIHNTLYYDKFLTLLLYSLNLLQFYFLPNILYTHLIINLMAYI